MPSSSSSRTLGERAKHVTEEHRPARARDTSKGCKTVCAKCGKSIAKSYAKTHDKACTGIPYQSVTHDFVFVPHPTDPRLCPEPGCNYQNEKTGRIKFHYTSQHVKKPCFVCNAVYKVVNMDGHLLTAHKIATARAKRFACTECDSTFEYKSQLRNHMDLEHIKELKYICDLCGMSFIARRLLYMHKDSAHTRAVRRNPCTVCGKNFRSVKPFKDHMLEAHGVTVK